MSFLLFLTSSLQQHWRRRQNSFCLDEGSGREREGVGRQGGEIIQTMFAHMNKRIKNKLKKPLKKT
jgi:hypothetical protein